MKTPHYTFVSMLGLLAALCVPAHAKVNITSLAPSVASPQAIGTPITWIAVGTDTHTGPLAFQFRVATPRHKPAMVIDFNLGTKKKVAWRSLPFVWTPTGIEGVYEIEVIAKDFTTNETDTKTVKYVVKALVTDATPVVVPTANPLVALFSAPPCPTGSSMRVSFQVQSGAFPAMMTNWMDCHPPNTMTFEIAGMYPSTAYQMFSETLTGPTTVNGTPLTFTTGPLPSGFTSPPYKTNVQIGSDTDTTDSIILHGYIALGGATQYPQIATDLSGNILWYYASGTTSDILTRPLVNGTFLTIQSGPVWNSFSQQNQLIRQVDLAGNIIRETNTGILQQELVAMGAADAGPCSAITLPAAAGSACLGGFHHDAIQTLPKGYTAIIADLEKIFPAGTQGDTTGMLVDVMGDIIIVLDADWKPVWYFDTFEHDSGAPQLLLSRPAVLGETCIDMQGGCPPIYLTTSANPAKDWLHANSLYYWPAPQNGNTTGGDIIWSSRHQDWVMRIDYKDGAGTGNIVWRMGPDGDFTIDSPDTMWPWFSHQHEVAMENGGTGPMTLFDNGNTRLSNPSKSTGGTPGLGKNCGPSDCNSRGMVVTFDETSKVVTAVLSQDLGEYGEAMGSAQLLYDGNYFFAATFVVGIKTTDSYAIELQPTTGVSGTQVLNLQSTESYRNWQMPSMYDPPIS